jgi:drug/metabolite transporter (DMT)-like permease
MSASAIFLDEVLPWWKIVAALLIMSGLVINLYANRPAAKAHIQSKNT